MFDWESFLASPDVFLNLAYILLVILFVLRLSSSIVRLPSGQTKKRPGKNPSTSRSTAAYRAHQNSEKRSPHPDVIWR